MIQCIICEDWYHSLHLDTDPSASHDYFEMICGPCVDRVDFLKDYTGLCVTAITSASGGVDESLLNVTTEGDTSVQLKKDSGEEKTATGEEKKEGEGDSGPDAKKVKLDDSEAASSSAASAPPVKCKRPTNPGHYKKGATFWPDDWREQLCVCSDCKSLYSQLKVEYLVDTEDTVKWYGDVGMKKLAAKESDYDRGMRQLGSLDRVRQIDAITAYNSMKDRLKTYLNQFVESQQVVTEADIKRFFAQMKNDDQKDLMVHSDIPFNCR